MSFVIVLFLLLALAISLSPLLLMERRDRRRAQDEVVASQSTRSGIVRNALVAYALRLTALGPLFAWGATGDLWPAAVASAAFGGGVWLIYRLRQPLVEFVDAALSEDRSITVHAFIAGRHGNDPRVRVVAAFLSAFALLGLVAAEVLVLVTILQTVWLPSAATLCLLMLGALLLTGLPSIARGHSGVMHVAQLQLGMLYLGLFASTVLLLYERVSDLAPLSPQGRLAVLVVAVICAVMLVYRRSRYIDTESIRRGGSERVSTGARLVSRFGKILNSLLTALLVIVIVIAAMSVSATGASKVANDSVAALWAGTRLSGLALFALCLLPLLYPIVDVTNWQGLAATRKDAPPVQPGMRTPVPRGFFATYAADSLLVGLFACMLGAIAVVTAGTAGGPVALNSLVARLLAGDSGISTAALPLFLLCLFAAVLSTTSMLFSALLCTLRYDILPGREQDRDQSGTSRRTIVAGSVLLLAVAGALCMATAVVRVDFTSGGFTALLFAVCCAQLAFVPLVLGPLFGRGAVSPGWALAILGVGAGSGAAAAAIHLVTGREAWLWSPVPACLGAALVLYVIARRASKVES